MNYYIGGKYRYVNDKQTFTLGAVRGCIFYFLCGHWCTDTIFPDLIRVKTGIHVSEDKQLKLFR